VATTRDDLVARPVTTGLGVLGMPGSRRTAACARSANRGPEKTVVVAARGHRQAQQRP
jgi:hypothetical protein